MLPFSTILKYGSLQILYIFHNIQKNAGKNGRFVELYTRFHRQDDAYEADFLKKARRRTPMKWMRLFPNRQKRIIGVIITAILVIAIRFIWPLVFSGYEQPKAVQGTLDLRQWDFQLKGNVKLNGEWAFVPHQFVSPSATRATLPEAKLVQVPHLWNYYLDEKKSTSFGFATYRLNILLPEKLAASPSASISYAFHITNIPSSHTLFVNGLPIRNMGSPGETYASSKPDNYPYIAFANVTGNKAEVLLHVANYDNKIGGGILLPIEFGTPEQILASKRSAEISDTAVISLFLLLSISCGFLYSYQPKQTHLLYFTLFCLFEALSVAARNEKLLITSALSFHTYSKLQVLPIVGVFFFYYMFVVRMYPELLKPIPFLIIRLVTVSFACLFLFTDLRFFSGFFYIWFPVCAILVFYLLVLFLKAVFAHREDAPFLFLAAIGLSCSGISYIMLVNGIVLPNVPPIDLIVFALSLMFLITHRFVRTMEQIKALSLQRARIEMAFMQAQIKPHFLFNSLNTIGSFIETEPYRAQDLLGEFSTYLRYSFDFTNLEPSVPFDREWTLVEAYLKLEQARYGEALEIYVDVEHAKSIRLPPLSLQPLVENAVRHGVMRRSEGGSIRITAKLINNEVELSVEDNGMGISDERLTNLLISTSSDEASITTDVSGIGLKNIQHRLVHTYGKGLMISSIVQQGTIVKFRIPKEMPKRYDFENTFG
jgi:two-component system LytT family sensor kinase